MRTSMTLFFLLMVLVFLSSCTRAPFNRDYTFSEGFDEYMRIDQKFNTSFHIEMLNSTMVPQEVIPRMREEVAELKAVIDETTSRNEFINHSQALSLFGEVRLLMLDSQLNYQRAVGIGPIGRVTDPYGFSCGEMKYVLLTANYLNQSYYAALFSQSRLDDLIYRFREIPEVRTLVGTDENKTSWYYSPLYYVKQEAEANVAMLKKRCNIDAVTMQPKF